MTGLASQAPDAIDRWSAWDRFLASTPRTGFMQSSWWADFRATAGFEHFGLTLRDRGEIIAGALVLKGWRVPGSCFYYIQDGPVLPDADAGGGQAFEFILETLDEQRRSETETVSHVRIEPRWQSLPGFVSGFRPAAFRDRYTEPRHTLCIDLRQAEETILARMKPKGRYNIRLAQKHGVTVLEDTSKQGLADFLRLYRRMTMRRRIEAKPADYFRTLASMLTPLQQVSIFFAEYEGRRIATALVVYFGGTATYFFGASLARHRDVMAPYLLHFEIIRRARAMGYEWYDFWGISPKDQPNHPWWNFSEFKRKFGGVEVELVPTLDHVYDPAAYDRYVASCGGEQAPPGA